MQVMGQIQTKYLSDSIAVLLILKNKLSMTQLHKLFMKYLGFSYFSENIYFNPIKCNHFNRVIHLPSFLLSVK